MSGVSLPVSRPAGRALLIGSQGCRNEPHNILRGLGFLCEELDDPYTAMAELHRRPLVYWALVLSLNSLYREELQIIAAVKRRWPHVEIWLSHTEGRAAAMAEAMRLGADGLLLEDGFHRAAMAPLPEIAPPRTLIASSSTAPALEAPTDVRSDATVPSESASTKGSEPIHESPPFEFSDTDFDTGEPILTAEELRALLQDAPVGPRSFSEE